VTTSSSTSSSSGSAARLAGRRILVTGASSGIGEAAARAVAAAGGRVALLARRAELLERLADDVGGVAVPADVVDVAAARAAVDQAADALGGLDGVLNVAGLARPCAIADADPADWRTTFEVNVLGLLHVTQAAIPHLRAATDAPARDVLNLSSMSGRRLGSQEMAVYAASKAAVHTVSEGLRRELQPDRIRVTVVAPGFVATPIFAEPEDDFARSIREKAQKVGLPPATVADALVDVLAAPAHLTHVEVALLSADQ
jgi:NADP-dependent 3-hydroxy acid dehydrogenase YdfG